jgi:hypothetical protein
MAKCRRKLSRKKQVGLVDTRIPEEMVVKTASMTGGAVEAGA